MKAAMHVDPALQAAHSVGTSPQNTFANDWTCHFRPIVY